MATSRKQKEEIVRFFREFKQMPKDVQKQTRPMLKSTVDSPVAQIKRNASWSERIPGAVRKGLSFSRRFTGATITVNRNRAPHARPYENQGKPGSFRHRVFGQNVWVSERARPFFYGVADEWQKDTVEKLGSVIDDVTRSHGFR